MKFDGIGDMAVAGSASEDAMKQCATQLLKSGLITRDTPLIVRFEWAYLPDSKFRISMTAERVEVRP